MEKRMSVIAKRKNLAAAGAQTHVHHTVDNSFMKPEPQHKQKLKLHINPNTYTHTHTKKTQHAPKSAQAPLIVKISLWRNSQKPGVAEEHK